MFNWDLDVDLLALLPPWYREVLDYQLICQAESEQLRSLGNNILQIDENFYFQTMDEPAVNLWEEIFEILPNRQTEELDFRRERLLNRIRTRPPFTLAFLYQTLNDLIGIGKWRADIDYFNYIINILLDYEQVTKPKVFFGEVMSILHLIKPAHMQLCPAMAVSGVWPEYLNQRLILHSLKLPLRIVNNTREIIRLNGERRLDGSWPLDQDVRSLIFQRLLVALALPEQERLSAAGVMRLQSGVQTAEKLLWPQLEIALRIGNLAFTRLNGEKRLDGSWFLEQIAGGVKLSSLDLKMVWRLFNRALANSSMHLPSIRLGNRQGQSWPQIGLCAKWRSETRAGQPEMRLQSSWQEQNRMDSGSLTRDTMWRLGGDEILDGHKKLNAAIVKEEL